MLIFVLRHTAIVTNDSIVKCITCCITI